MNKTTQAKMKKVISTRITTIAGSEKITKAEMKDIALELLQYVPATGDIGMVNRLLDVLTPKNRAYAVIFYRSMLEWNYDNEKACFTDKVNSSSTKTLEKIAKARSTFLNDEGDYWVWLEENTEPAQKKAPDYHKSIQQVVKRALSDEEHGISSLDILRDVIQGGVSITSLIALADEQNKKAEAEEKRPALKAA